MKIVRFFLLNLLIGGLRIVSTMATFKDSFSYMTSKYGTSSTDEHELNLPSRDYYIKLLNLPILVLDLPTQC